MRASLCLACDSKMGGIQAEADVFVSGGKSLWI